MNVHSSIACSHGGNWNLESGIGEGRKSGSARRKGGGSGCVWVDRRSSRVSGDALRCRVWGKRSDRRELEKDGPGRQILD